MKQVGSWLRRAGMNFTGAVQRFMMGRYGHDRLNMALLIVGLVLSVLSMFVGNKLLDLILTLGMYALLTISLVRCFSRNTYKRYRENRKFLSLLQRCKDREHRYFCCPRCRQSVRVPRGKGKIAINCPKCHERFIKKT